MRCNNKGRRGLCYNCDEKFVPGHQCKAQQIFVLKLDDEEESVDEEVGAETKEELDYVEETPSDMEIF